MWLIYQILWLWLITAAIVVIASVIHYIWSTNTRKNLARKYRRRSPSKNQQFYEQWNSRRE